MAMAAVDGRWTGTREDKDLTIVTFSARRPRDGRDDTSNTAQQNMDLARVIPCEPESYSSLEPLGESCGIRSIRLGEWWRIKNRLNVDMVMVSEF